MLDEGVWPRLRSEVRSLFQKAVDEVFPGGHWEVPEPGLFGSREYGLSDENSSDVDLYVLAPEWVLLRGDDIRGIVARGLLDKGVRWASVVDQSPLQTLKWVIEDRAREISVSVLLSDKRRARGALTMTAFLKDFYADDVDYGTLVRDILKRLREAGALNKHGIRESVGQDLKTASVALFFARA